MIAVRGGNLALSFLLELGLLAALGYWGYESVSSFWLAVLLGALLPVVVAIVWGVFLAPKASIPVPEPWHTVFAVLLFALATAALFAAHQPILALIYAVLVVVNQLVRFAIRPKLQP